MSVKKRIYHIGPIGLLTAVLGGLFVYGTGHIISYRQGYSLSGNNLMATQIMVAFFYIVICALFSLLMLTKSIWNIIKRQKNWFNDFLFCLCILFICYLSIEITTPIRSSFEKGFRKRITQEIDPASLRIFVKSNQSLAGSILTEDQYPDNIHELQPNKYVKIDQDRNGYFLRLAWGSPLGHFGIALGQEDWIPSIDPFEEFFEMDKGMYFWREK